MLQDERAKMAQQFQEAVQEYAKNNTHQDHKSEETPLPSITSDLEDIATKVRAKSKAEHTSSLGSLGQDDRSCQIPLL